MQVYVTPDHDTTMINSEIVELLQDSDPTEEELKELDVPAIQYYDCYGDDYADAVMMSHLEEIQY